MYRVNNKLGCISAKYIIIWTGILMLVWAFGSYGIYVLTATDPAICFPPFSGCTSISKAGSYPISGFFYRLMILPLAPFLGISMYFIIQFLNINNPNVTPNIKKILFVFGCIVLPISLIVSEAFKDGHMIHPSYIGEFHQLFAGFAFLGMIAFQVICSLQFLKKQSTMFYKFIFFFSVLPILIALTSLLINIQNIHNLVEWNIFIVIIIWNILIGFKINTTADNH